MRIYTGVDIQEIAALATKPGLVEGRHWLTEYERDYVGQKKRPLATLTGLVSAKEAFIKAFRGTASDARFTFLDVELRHDRGGRPRFRFGGLLQRFMQSNSIAADVSISHSGEYAAAFVLLYENLAPRADNDEES